MSPLLNPIPNVVAIAGLAVPLLPSDAQSVPLPAEYYAQSAETAPEQEVPDTPARTPRISQAQLQGELDSALQKSGLHAEIENEESGLINVRFIQADTGAAVLQFPPQTIPDLIDTLTNASSDFPDLAGHLVDQSA